MPSVGIREKHPTGEGSFAAIRKRIEGGTENASDMREVFRGITPDIKQALKYAFSDANPSGWQSLKEKYLKWKTDNGYPATIGVLTGDLKKSVTDDADVDIQKQKMKYKINEKTGNVKEYAHWFNEKRDVMEYAKGFIREKIGEAVRAEIRRGFATK